MLEAGQAEIEAVSNVIASGQLFRYREESECDRFERRYAEALGVHHVILCSSGTTALTAALAGLDIGPGDEVLVPAHTYMASALAVLAVGAIPVVVDIDDSITMDPDAAEAAVGPHTRAVMPVHMWGAVCNMDALLHVAAAHDLAVVEDACQCVGGSYRDRPAGSMGDASAVSFNYFKNMTCGEGGAVITRSEKVAERASCMIDPCRFYWQGRETSPKPFAHPGARASELQGAMLNVQLDRLPTLIASLRALKTEILSETADIGLGRVPRHSPGGECATTVMYRLPSAEAAEHFSESAGGTVLMNTGRHTYTEWDPVLNKRGAHHPDLDPFRLTANAACRTEYSRDMCQRSLAILARTVSIGLKPGMASAERTALIERIRKAGADALSWKGETGMS